MANPELQGARRKRRAPELSRYVGLGSTSARRGRAPHGVLIGGATGTTWEPRLPGVCYPPRRAARVAVVAPVRQRVRRLAA